MTENYGTLHVFSSGHEYMIKDISESLADQLMESFWVFHNHDGEELDWMDHDPDSDFWLYLPHGKIDAIAFQRDEAA